MKRLLFVLIFLPAILLPAEVTLPKIFATHMVVQRDLPVHVWGWASPGETVNISFRGESLAVRAGALGRWSAYLKPGQAGGPFTMTVRGSAGGQPIAIEDVMVGDVWVASGQSNMEFLLEGASTAAQDVPKAANTGIRLLIVKKRAIDYPLDDIESDVWEGWAVSSPEAAAKFSAVGYYFAREIEQREHVPVGIIDASWGGTVADTWTRLEALGEDAALAPVFAAWGKMTEREVAAQLQEKDEQRQRAQAKAEGRPEPKFAWHPMLDSWGPGMLYNGMIAPLTPFAIRGVIWYQGESNSALARAPHYSRVFSTMIEDWRRQWGIGDFPFLYVQISDFKSTPAEDWATLREQQRKTLALRNTAMAVTIDIGNPDDVHPKNKLDVGLRLARAARAIAYGEKVEFVGPMFRQATPEGGAVRAYFDHAAGLNAKGGTVTGFEVAGSDLKFVAASARIDGATVVAEAPSVHEPVYVRYGWANSPQCNLFDGEGLPASPFTSVP